MSRAYTPNDKWAQRAKAGGFRARSVFKLQELDNKYHLLHPGMQVLDIGAAPGSWLQYASGIADQVTGLDIQRIAPVATNVTTIVGDIGSFETEAKFDLILSDIAPSTTGMPLVDQAKSIELNKRVFELSKRVLNPGGTLVMKVFDGREFQAFVKQLKDYFSDMTVQKPAASRDRSREIYVICR